MKKSNIIIISIDTLRADEVGCINPTSDLTPNIDKFAKTGKIFLNCFSQGPRTPSSFPSLMTSTYPLMFGGYTDKGISRRVSITEILQKNGYSTAGFTSNAFHARPYGYHKGFDFYYDGLEKKRGWALDTLDSIRRKNENVAIIIRRIFGKLKIVLSPFINLKLSPKDPYIAAEKILALANEYMRKTTGVFFLWVHIMDAHVPYPNGDDKITAKMLLHCKGEYQFSVEEISELRKQRIAQIRYIDEKIGEFINKLKADNFYDNTYIIICSDHGEEFLEHGNLGHEDKLYDELIHVPLIANIGNGKFKGLCENLDIAPTIAQLAGIEQPKIFMGKPLGTKKEEIFAEVLDVFSGHNKICVRTKKWKLIHNSDMGSTELYDLEKDPKEKKDISSSNPKIVDELMDKIKTHQKKKRSVERKTLLYKVKPQILQQR